MKGMTHNKTVLHRFIAFVMAIVMVLTLVAVDSHFNLFADEDGANDENTEIVDITEMLTSDKDSAEDNDIYVVTEKEYIKFTVDSEKAGVSADDLRYEKNDEVTATPADASKLKNLDTAIAVTDENGGTVNVNIYRKKTSGNKSIRKAPSKGSGNGDDYDYLGKLAVSDDTTPPEIGTVEVVAKADSSLNVIEKDGTYIVASGKAELKATVKDAGTDGDDAVGLSKVEFYKGDVLMETVDAQETLEEFAASMTLTESGVYTIKAYDSNDNSATSGSSYTVKVADATPSIKSVTYDVENAGATTGYLLAPSKLKVSVKTNDSKADDTEVAYTLKSYVKYVSGDGETVVLTIDGKRNASYITEGEREYTFEIPLMKNITEAGVQKTYSIFMTLSDELGNVAPSTDLDGRIVFTDGEITTFTATAKDTGVVKGTTIDLNASNNYSYLKSVTYKIDGGDGVTTVADSISAFTYKKSLSVVGGSDATGDIKLSDGEHTISFTATSVTGVTKSANVSVAIDTEAPVVSVTYGGASVNPTVGESYNIFSDEGKATVKVSCEDKYSTVNSEVTLSKKNDSDKTYVEVKNAASKSAESTDKSNSYDVAINESGTYKLVVTAKDSLGNEAAEKTVYIYANLDPVEAYVEITTDAAPKKNIEAKTTYTNSNVNISCTVTGYEIDKNDIKVYVQKTPLSGGNTVDVSSDVITDKAGTNKVELTGSIKDEGVYTIKIGVKRHNYGSDYAFTNDTTIYLDKNAPAVLSMELKDAITKDGVSYYDGKTTPSLIINATENNNANQDISVSYTVGDGKTEYGAETIKSNSGKIENAVVNLSEWCKKEDYNKDYVVNLYLTDAAGNKMSKAAVSAKFHVDTKAPNVTIKTDGGAISDSDVAIKWSATDGEGSGVDKYMISYDVYDMNGIKIDALSKDQDKKEDLGSKPEKTFKRDASSSYTYENIIVYAYDMVGNEAKKNFKDVVVDTKAPVVTNKDGRNLNEKLEIFEVADDTKIKDVTVTAYYKTYKDGDVAEWKEDTDNVNIIKELSEDEKTLTVSCKINNQNLARMYYFEISGTDAAGNKIASKKDDEALTSTANGYETSKEKPYYVDTMKPTVSISGVKAGSYYNSAVTLNIAATDQFPNIDAIKGKGSIVIEGSVPGNDKYKKTVDVKEQDGGKEWSGSLKYKIQGKYSLKVTATDQFGNYTTIKDYVFYIDKTGPDVSVKLTVEKDASDSGSTVNKDVKDVVANGSTVNKDVEVVATIKDYVYKDENNEKNSIPGEIKSKKITVKRWKKSLGKYDKGNPDSERTYEDKEWCTIAADEEGLYKIQVEATDAAGNVKTVTVTVTIDTTKPMINVTPNTLADYSNKAQTIGVDVTDDYGLNGVSITDNNGGNITNVTKFDSKRDSYSYTSNKVTFDTDNGTSHDYDVDITATDKADNKRMVTKKFVIDKVKPTVTITSGDKEVSNSAVTVGFRLEDDKKGDTYTVHYVRKDSSGNIVAEGDKEKAASWANGNVDTSVSFEDEGDYEVTITAKDMAGNVSDEAKAAFRIDKSGPSIEISGMSDRQTTSVTGTVAVNEAYSLDGYDKSTSSIAVNITRKTDGTAESAFATLSMSDFSGGNPHTASRSFTEDGEYTITANATDLAGNTASQTKTFKIDGTAPVITMTAIDKDSKAVNTNAVIGSADATAANYVDMALSIEEAFFASDDVDIKVTKDGKDVSASYFTNYSNSAEISRGTQRFSEDGVYSVSVTAKDELGNEAEPYSIVFTVDNVPPTVEATSTLAGFRAKSTVSDDGTLLLNASDFADILSKGYDSLWNVSDTSIFTVNAKLDGVDLVDFSNMADGYHKIDIEVVDQVGHVTTDSFEFTYDGTAPRIIISGVEDGDTKREPFAMTIGLEDEADEITSIVINGNTIDPANYADNKYEMQVEEYDTYVIEVTAKDKAGNIASTFNEDTQSYFTFKLSEKLSPVVIVIIIVVAILLIALLLFVIIAGRRRKRNAAA